jgi:hypothetical protein
VRLWYEPCSSSPVALLAGWRLPDGSEETAHGKELLSRPGVVQQALHREAEIFNELRLERSHHAMKPLFEGEWQ